MNIFILHSEPEKAAKMLCDKHVPKMFLETVQLLCGVFDHAPYKKTHYNHPCAKWLRESKANFDWLLSYGSTLAEEYTFRYNKIHKSEKVLDWVRENEYLIHTKYGMWYERTPFAQAMPEQYKCPKSATVAYRRYYKGDKARFAKWLKGRKEPRWWREYETK